MRRGAVTCIVAVAFAALTLVAGSSGAGSPGAPPPKSVGTFTPPRPQKDGQLDARLADVPKTADAPGGCGSSRRSRARKGLARHGKRLVVVVETGDPSGRQRACARSRRRGGALTGSARPGRRPSGSARGTGPRERRAVRAAALPRRGGVRHGRGRRHDERVGLARAQAYRHGGEGGDGRPRVRRLAAAQEAGDLPGRHDGRLLRGQLEGTSTGGVAEIVHEMAPDAALTLICVDTEVGLGQAVDYARSNGITIVNHSVGWFDSGRGDGSGGPGRRTQSSPTRARTASCGSTRPATTQHSTGPARSPTERRLARLPVAMAPGNSSSSRQGDMAAPPSSGTPGPPRRRTTTSTSAVLRRRSRSPPPRTCRTARGLRPRRRASRTRPAPATGST